MHYLCLAMKISVGRVWSWRQEVCVASVTNGGNGIAGVCGAAFFDAALSVVWCNGV